MARTFATSVAPRLDRVGLAPEVRAATDRQLVKMTGAELDSVVALQPSQRAAVREAIDGAFVIDFRLLMLMAAALALLSAVRRRGHPETRIVLVMRRKPVLPSRRRRSI